MMTLFMSSLMSLLIESQFAWLGELWEQQLKTNLPEYIHEE